MANSKDKASRAMERQRDLQAELGALLDRFYVSGLTAGEIVEIICGESEIWEHRLGRPLGWFDDSEDPHQRPHPPFGGAASHPVLGSPGREPANT